jgi:divalent metal cation (Fe/Co/Zn/Cd) transporter
VGSVAIVDAVASGGLTLLGFGVDAVIDAGASAALIWRFRVETTMPHRARRVETLAERIVGVALIALAVYLVGASLRALASHSHAERADIGTVILIASIVALPPLAVAKRRVAERLHSRALRADSILTAVAAVLAVISLASEAVANAVDWWWADAVGAIIVAAVVLREGWASLALARKAEGRGTP